MLYLVIACFDLLLISHRLVLLYLNVHRYFQLDDTRCDPVPTKERPNGSTSGHVIINNGLNEHKSVYHTVQSDVAKNNGSTPNGDIKGCACHYYHEKPSSFPNPKENRIPKNSPSVPGGNQILVWLACRHESDVDVISKVIIVGFLITLSVLHLSLEGRHSPVLFFVGSKTGYRDESAASKPDFRFDGRTAKDSVEDSERIQQIVADFSAYEAKARMELIQMASLLDLPCASSGG